MELQLPVKTEHRAGRMIAALLESDHKGAKVVLTVELEVSDAKYHQTFDIRKWNRRDGATILQVQVKGSADWSIGRPPITVISLDLDDLRFLMQQDRRADDRTLRYAAEAALMYAWTGETKTPRNGSVRVLEESVCGRCGLALTNPESIDIGIGPECAKKVTGTTTIMGRTRKGAKPTEGQEALA